MRDQWVKQLRFRHAGQVVVAAFAAAVAVGTALLMLPIATTAPGSAPVVTAVFHATSAVCVTGLSTVDTPNYWTPFGQVVILVLIQIGGFGVMTLASLLAIVLTKKLGLRSRLTAASETKAEGLGDIRNVLFGVVRVTCTVEILVATALTLRWWLGYGHSFGRAAYLGVFHAVSAFNNAGFALFSDNLMSYARDVWIIAPISAAIILGGLGFPVIMEVIRVRRRRRWSLHTKITLMMSTSLLLIGAVVITAVEWSNPKTLGQMGLGEKLLVGTFHSVSPRTAGFNAWDYGQVDEGTLLSTIILMFIGGGSAGTAGGIKVTTFFLLLVGIVSEMRGETHATIFERRIADRTMRQALNVALIGIAAVVASTLILTQISDIRLAELLFESTSAFATVGLSTGVTAKLPDAGQLLLVALMFLGRLGPITLVSALALRESTRRYTYPEGRPLIG
ncbi:MULTISPECIES: TrkH family potassium uptake protein [unclassified Dermacoccus]|uniref:TrkH family potassium uptake protein n=1 Tax=unclassified Dermacoccus TaxID=2643059 RepID=UPI00101C91A0|nr:MULTISPECIES: potassium transporter TrkG [unclassified Dermacoccus]MBZ4497776.1 TrkH family potassium uptake protein [Dermacoccus sp. Tok2021]RYI20839.1 TrkH family potassium uptake protein [Dermacoccus sp. 147Ba]